MGRQLPVTAFPVLTLREHWEDPRAEVLIAEFLDWRAPLLLTLFGLPRQIRRRLEQAAYRNGATQVLALHRGYPEIIDEEGLRAALAASMLRRAQDT